MKVKSGGLPGDMISPHYQTFAAIGPKPVE